MAELPRAIVEKTEELKRELAKLEREAREDIPAEMASAQSVGPVRENADMYLVAGRAHYLQGRILTLRQRLKALQSMDPAAIARDRAGYGSVLTLKDLDTGETRTVRLASPEEATGSEVCSLLSPMGKALRNKQAGDEVEVYTPGGMHLYRVESLKTLFDQEEDSAGAGGEGE